MRLFQYKTYRDQDLDNPPRFYRCISCWEKKSSFSFPLVSHPHDKDLPWWEGRYRHSLLCTKCKCKWHTAIHKRK